jgi:hypothetical protein
MPAAPELTPVDQWPLDPVDWPQLYLLAKLTPGQRMMTMAQASAFARGILRGAFRRRFPNLTMAEINMKMMQYLSNAPEYFR